VCFPAGDEIRLLRLLALPSRAVARGAQAGVAEKAVTGGSRVVAVQLGRLPGLSQVIRELK